MWKVAKAYFLHDVIGLTLLQFRELWCSSRLCP
nr:MAG TPA: hypothetical protein [Caudoviricetes sp.]